MESNGTFSIDLLFATFIFLIIIGSTIALISDRFSIVDDSKELVEARSLAENIAGTIDQVYAGGDGHKIRIHMPNSINKDSKYAVDVNSSGVLVNLNGKMGLAYMVPKKISNKIDVLNDTTVTLYPGQNYDIINKKEDKGDNWIIIL